MHMYTYMHIQIVHAHIYIYNMYITEAQRSKCLGGVHHGLPSTSGPGRRRRRTLCWVIVWVVVKEFRIGYCNMDIE